MSYKFKKGDRIKVLKLKEGYHKEDNIKLGMIGTVIENDSERPWVEFDEDINGKNSYNGSNEKRTMCMWEDEIDFLYTRGLYLLQLIKEGLIKNCDIKVYKNNKYKFTIQCGEKAILDNPKHHIGMLTSDKYTYEPIIKKEMTVSEIEKELGYPIKIVKD